MKPITHNIVFLFDKPISVNWKYVVKRLLLPLLDCLYKCLAFINRSKSRTTKKYNLVACAIFRDEAPFLREWVEHNNLVGIEHFYLYNNFSEDNYQEVLQPYIDNGIVNLIDWPVEQGQLSAYNHFMENFRTHTQWVTFIDIDEFYCPLENLNLNDWLEKYRNYPIINVYWRMFTTSGKIEHDFSKPVIEQYTMAVEKILSIGKVFVNTSWDICTINDMHLIYAKVKFSGATIIIPPVNEFKKIIKWNIHRFTRKSKITITLNHYFSKSYNELVYRKIKRGDAVFANRKQIERVTVMKYYEHQKQIANYDVYRFLIELKLKLANNDL